MTSSGCNLHRPTGGWLTAATQTSSSIYDFLRRPTNLDPFLSLSTFTEDSGARNTISIMADISARPSPVRRLRPQILNIAVSETKAERGPARLKISDLHISFWRSTLPSTILIRAESL